MCNNIVQNTLHHRILSRQYFHLYKIETADLVLKPDSHFPKKIVLLA